MKYLQTSPKSIDDYISGFPDDLQKVLERIRRTIRKAVPRAQEKISYKMPAFTLDGDLIYFAAFKNHIGIFPPVRGDAKLNKELSRYRGEKGNLKFPLDEPIPYELIGRLVKFRIKEHLEKLSTKRNKKKAMTITSSNLSDSSFADHPAAFRREEAGHPRVSWRRPILAGVSFLPGDIS